MTSEEIYSNREMIRSIGKLLMRDNRMKVVEIERGDYFRMINLTDAMAKALNVRTDSEGNVINGGDDFLMYIPWSQRRMMFDKLANLRIGESVSVVHSLVGRNDLIENCKSTLYALSLDGSTKSYVCMCDFDSDDSEENDEEERPHIKIRTFGYFDIFVDGAVVAFKSAKAKELLALLVDRRGGYVSSREAISCLWEDDVVNKTTLARYRKVASRLENELAENGIGYIVRKNKGERRIETSYVECDLFDFFDGDENMFRGIYMNNYAWAENSMGGIIAETI